MPTTPALCSSSLGAEHRFECSKDRHRVAQVDTLGEEATPVEGTRAQDQCLIPWQWCKLRGGRQAERHPAMRRLHVHASEAGDHSEIPENRAPQSEAIAR